jgi:hypothetical protein
VRAPGIDIFHRYLSASGLTYTKCRHRAMHLSDVPSEANGVYFAQPVGLEQIRSLPLITARQHVCEFGYMGANVQLNLRWSTEGKWRRI